MKRLIFGAVCCVLLAPFSTAADWGTITGRIVLDEKEAPKPEIEFLKGGAKKDPGVCSATDVYKQDLLVNADNLGIANAFVYLSKAPKDVHPDLSKPNAKVYFDQRNCVYLPRALVVQAGQTVEVLNADNVAHNTQTSSLRNTQYNFTIPAGARKGDGVDYALPQKEPLPFEVKCSFHTHMFAYWLVLDHPYAAATDKDGKFTIKNLPAGSHTLRIWHERAGYLDRSYKVTVEKGDNELKPVGFKLEKFEEDE